MVRLGTVSVRDYLPLQQGLRRGMKSATTSSMRAVRDYLPLQQGLRPVPDITFLQIYNVSETIFHYNKD